MLERDRLAAAVALACILLAALTMYLAHERHYRRRRLVIGRARGGTLEQRLAALESILAEDRLT